MASDKIWLTYPSLLLKLSVSHIVSLHVQYETTTAVPVGQIFIFTKFHLNMMLSAANITN